MANARSGNTYWVDTTSSSGDSSSFLSIKGLALVGVVYQVAATTDVLTVSDLGSDGASAGATKFKLKAGTANDSRQQRLADAPVVFPNGVWFTLTGSPTATLIFAVQQGNGS